MHDLVCKVSYVPPTSSKCSRVKASNKFGSLYMPLRYDISIEENYVEVAAKKLARDVSSISPLSISIEAIEHTISKNMLSGRLKDDELIFILQPMALSVYGINP